MYKILLIDYTYTTVIFSQTTVADYVLCPFSFLGLARKLLA